MNDKSTAKKRNKCHANKKKTIMYFMFLKEKRDRSIKARGFADGKSQQEYTMKAETSFPTMFLEAMMMMCTIDTKERRYVTVTDIPGAFLHVIINKMYTSY